MQKNTQISDDDIEHKDSEIRRFRTLNKRISQKTLSL